MQKLIFSIVITLLLTISVGLSSCSDSMPQEDDATPYIVNITFSKPSVTTVTKNQSVPLDIRFDRNPSGYIHYVKVEVFDNKGVSVQKLFDSNVHTFKTYTYSEAVAFKPLSMGTFTIKVSTTNEMKKEENTKEFNLTVQ